MESEEESAPLLSLRQLRSSSAALDQAYVQSSISQHFYSSLSVFVLSVVLAVCKVRGRQVTAGVGVLWIREDQAEKPIREWLAGVVLQDAGYLAFLAGVKFRYIEREAAGLVLKEPCWVVVLDKAFTM
jgi:hypothetical protein